MLSQQQLQQLQQQTVVMDAGPIATDDVRDMGACNHRAAAPLSRPIITRTEATPLLTPRRSASVTAGSSVNGMNAGDGFADDDSSDVMARDNNSEGESFVTSLAGYSDTLSYEASYT